MKKKENFYTTYIVLRGFEAGTFSIIFGLILLSLLIAGIQ
ncbi:hypothetical protein FHS86_001820 [Roseimarinus sediminis]